MAAASETTAATPVSIVFYRDLYDKISVPHQTTWGGVVELLTNPECVQSGPCTVAEGPNKCKGKGDKSSPKGCPHKSSSTDGSPMAWVPVEIEGNRLDENVRFTTLLTLDFDDLTPEQATQVHAALASHEYCWHSTHQNRLDNVRFRAVLLLSRKVHANQWHRFLDVAIKYLGVTVSAYPPPKNGKPSKPKQQPDPTCSDRARLFYRPSHPVGAPHAAGYTSGKVLDVDGVFAWGVLNVPESTRHDSARTLPEEQTWDLGSDAVVGAIDAGARFFPTERRNEFCMALAGMLRQNGATQSDAKYIVEEIAREGGSNDPEARAKTVDHTYRLPPDASMTGFTRAVEIVGEDAAKEIGDFLLEARHESLLSKMLPSSTQRVNGHTTTSHNIPPVPPIIGGPPLAVELAPLREILQTLAARRGRSLERDDQIDAVLFRRVLHKQSLGFPGGVGDVETKQPDSDRGISPQDALQKLAGKLAYAFPPETPWEAAAALLRPSAAASEGVVLAEAEKTYLRAQKRRDIADAEYRLADAEARARIAAKAAVAEGESCLFPDGPDWEKEVTKDKNGAPTNELNNLLVTLRNHPSYCGHIRFNEVTKKVEVRGGPLEAAAKHGFDVLVTRARALLQSVQKLSAGKSDVVDGIAAIACENAYDPIQEYLLGLKWDGTERLSTWLSTYCGAASGEGAEAEYVRVIGKRWMIAAAARALQPGCKCDTMLILESEVQGRGKSTAFDTLGGEWFCDTPLDVRSKDSRGMAAKHWILEMGELQSFKTADFNEMKSYLSARRDNYRPAYAKDDQEFLRRAVFGGTTNKREYLTDDTGNRRYLPVHIDNKIDIGKLQTDRDQLFAEAVHLFLAARACPDCAVSRVERSDNRCAEHRWWLTEYEEKLAEEEVSKREEEIPWKLKLHEWWLNIKPIDRPQKIAIEDVATDVLDIGLDRLNDRVRQQIGTAMAKLGFKIGRPTIGGIRHKFYIPSRALLETEHIKKTDRISKTLFTPKSTSPSAPTLPAKN